MKKSIFPVFVMILGLLSLFIPIRGFTKTDSNITKIVVQMNDKDRKVLEGGFKNIENIIEVAKTEKQDVIINVVVFGSAMNFFTKSSKENFSANLAIYKNNKNIKFLACNNTMKKMNLSKNDLIEGFNVIPSGAWEVIKLQKEGYQYFKP